MQALLSQIRDLKTMLELSNRNGWDDIGKDVRSKLNEIHEASRVDTPVVLPREAVGCLNPLPPIQTPVPIQKSITIYKKSYVVPGARYKPSYISVERLRGIMVWLSEFTDEPWQNLHPTIQERHAKKKKGYQPNLEQIDFFLTGNLDTDKGLLKYLSLPEISICEESIRAYAAQNGWPMEHQWGSDALDGENRSYKRSYKTLVRPKRLKTWLTSSQ
jgi:hypothetical protein